jgi:hypothetical protein
VPAILAHLLDAKLPFVSEKARQDVTEWFKETIHNAGLIQKGKFVVKDDFRKLGFLGSGGIGRFRNLLWAAAYRKRNVSNLSPEDIAKAAGQGRAEANKALSEYAN